MTPNKAMSDFYQFPDLTGMPGLPPPNPKLPKKAWADPNASLTEPMIYQVWNGSDTEPALVPIIVPWEMRLVNLPGDAPVFQAYTPQGTTAVGSIPNGLSSNSIAPLLSMRADADKLAALIPGTTVIDPYDPQVNSFQHIVYPPTELRRTWMLKYPSGLESFVGGLISSQNSKGVGFPGSWDTSNGSLVWAPGDAPTGKVADGPAVPFPISLPSGAKLASVMVGIVPTVQVQMGDSSAPAAGGGGLTADQDRRLARVEKMLEALLIADRVALPPA